MHTAVAAAQPEWRDIVHAGVWNSVQAKDHAATSTVWFTLSGAALGGIGLMTWRSVRDTGAVPPDTGWVLIGVGVPLSILDPASGGWLVTAVGVLALVARRAAAAETCRQLD